MRVSRSRPSAWVWPAGALLLAASGDPVRAALRRRAVIRAFNDETLGRLRGRLHLDRWATPLWMLIPWSMSVRALFGNRMRWRGILYRLDGPQKCERIEK